VGGAAVSQLAEGLGARASEGLPIRWSPLLEIGVPALDDEHRGLVEHLNALSRAIVTGSEPDVAAAAFAALRKDLDRHFRHEEALFHEHAPALELMHGEGQRHFEDGVLAIRETLLGGDRRSAAQAIARVAQYLVEHILVDDKEFMGSIRGLGG
jgi:hemerythrin